MVHLPPPPADRFRPETGRFPFPPRPNTAHRRVERTPVSWEDGSLLFPLQSEITVMTYRAPIYDILLALNHGAGLQAAVKAGHYGDFDGDITAAVLEEAGKFAGDVLAPLNRVGDEHGIKLEANKVTTAPGWPDAYQRWAAAGWNAVSGPEAFGGQGLPLAINAACTEIWSASNIAFGLCPLLTLSRDRGARRPWQRRAEEDLSGETRVGRMDRHHAAHRAAGRLRRRRAAHPRRARRRRQLSHQGHENLHHLWRPRHDR